MVTSRFHTELWRPRRPEVLRPPCEHLGQNHGILRHAIGIHLGLIPTKPPMRIDRILSEIRPSTVNMAANANAVEHQLSHAMFVRKTHIETDFAETNVLDRVGCMP